MRRLCYNISVNRVTAVLLGRVGDLVVSTAFLKSLRQAYPRATISLIVRSYCLEAAGMIPSVDEVSTPAALKWLRPSDLLVDLNPSPSTSSAILSALSPAKDKIKARQGAEKEHMLERYAKLAAQLGLPYGGTMELSAPAFQKPAGGKLRLLIHPGNFKKFENRWPEENFRALNAALCTDPSIEITYLSGPGEREQVEAIAQGLPVVGPAPLPEIAAEMLSRHALLCNITGTTHLAAALGVPTFGLYAGYTDAVWRPRGDSHGGVVAGSWESCRGITVEEALSALKPFLGRLSARA